jgi:hypothetical protein
MTAIARDTMVRQPLSKTRSNTARFPRAVDMALLLGLSISIFLFSTYARAENRTTQWHHFEHLLDFIRMEERQDPLVEFTQTSEGLDAALSLENRRFISQNEGLLEDIRTELNGNTLNWKLRQATTRLMVVPEAHPDYAALFERYCYAVIDYVLQETRLPNPYQAITTLDGPPADPIHSVDDGITAYLVHNIADVYSEEYEFFAAIDNDRSIRITLDNRTYRGEIGSYSSFLVIDEDRQYRFEHNPYTLWRNSAEDPLNVLIAPVEETLHIALRDATEGAIKSRLSDQPPSTRADMEAVVEEWLAIEEAAVGGLVSALLPEILDRIVEGDSAADVMRTLAERQAFEKYRYLDQGIAVVNTIGIQSTIAVYLEQTHHFKAMLASPPGDGTATADEETQDAVTTEPAA